MHGAAGHIARLQGADQHERVSGMNPPAITLAALLCALTATGHAQQETPRQPAPTTSAPTTTTVLSLRLVEGVHLIGTPVDGATIRVKFPFGTTRVPLALLTAVDFRGGPEKARFRFANGDLLTGEPIFKQLKIKTRYGLLTIPRGDLLALATGSKGAGFSGSTEGLVLHLPLEGDAKDKSGNNLHGAAQGSIRYVSAGSGKAALFTGSQGIVIANNSKLQLAGSMTAAIWLRPSALGGRRNPLDKCWGGEMSVTIEPDGMVNFYYGITGNNSGSFATLPTKTRLVQNRWTHLCAVRDMKTRKLRWYVNGKLNNEVPAQFPKAAASSLPIQIGRGYTGTGYAGQIKDVRLYRRAISAEEVAQLYKSLSGQLRAGR